VLLVHQCGDSANHLGPETSAPRKPHRIEPELRNAIVALDMDMGGLSSIGRIKEKAIRANPQDCRHDLLFGFAQRRDLRLDFRDPPDPARVETVRVTQFDKDCKGAAQLLFSAFSFQIAQPYQRHN
jgi:hypothetical protein